MNPIAVPEIALDAIPAEMRAARRWVVWRLETRGDKRTKVPIRSGGGGRASSVDEGTWSTFGEAVAGLRPGVGLGFVLGDGWIGVDLDGVLDADSGLVAGFPLADALGWVQRLGSYAERSPSGRGLHVIGEGELPAWAVNRRGPVEVYGAGRFFTVTGDVFEGLGTVGPLRELDAFLDAAGLRRAEPTPSRAVARFPVNLDDEELLERAHAAANGAGFARLWGGDSSGYPSASEADLALASMLSFWTGGDEARVDRMFRASGLFRPKWDSPRGSSTYGALTIETALAGQVDHYRGRENREPVDEKPRRRVADADDDHRDDDHEGRDRGNGALDAVLADVRRYLDVDEGEEAFIVAVLATATSKALVDEEPLWLLIIGPSGGGKSEAIRLLDQVVDRRVDELTRAGLLSWAPGRKAKRVGLLTRIPADALVTISDFSTVVTASDRDGRARMFGMLRVVYDGHVYRGIGGEPASDGDELEWSGHLTLIAAATTAIDSHTSFEGALGERWLMLRLAESTAERARRRARFAVDRDKVPALRAAAQETTRRLVDAAKTRIPSRLDPELVARLVDVATFVAHARTGVQHEGQGRGRVIVGLPTPEEPTRLIGQLARLARCSIALGLTAEGALALATTAAVDSVPLARIKALRAVAATGEAGATVADVHRALGRGNRWAAIWELDAVEAIGLVHVEGPPRDENPGAARIYRLNPEWREVYENVLLPYVSPLHKERSSEGDLRIRTPLKPVTTPEPAETLPAKPAAPTPSRVSESSRATPAPAHGREATIVADAEALGSEVTLIDYPERPWRVVAEGSRGRLEVRDLPVDLPAFEGEAVA